MAYVNQVDGAVTCAGKLSIVVEYAEESVTTETINRTKDQATKFLLDCEVECKSYITTVCF